MSDIEGQRSSIILESPRRSRLVKWVKLGVNHVLSCCGNRIIVEEVN
jgi:hypothetical protein